MRSKKFKFRFLQFILLLIMGLFLGVGIIWPGLTTVTGRKCFFKIIKDGIDGNVSLGTIFSITPNYLLKINNAENKYIKILLIGDYCFKKI